MIGHKLHELYNYYLINRNVGHTTLMKVGTNDFNREKLVLCVDMKHGRDMGLLRSEIVTLNSLDRLIGNNKPLVMDNYTLIEIFSQTVSTYNRLKEETSKAQDEQFKLERQVRSMKSQPFRTFFKTIFGLWQH